MPEQTTSITPHQRQVAEKVLKSQEINTLDQGQQWLISNPEHERAHIIRRALDVAFAKQQASA